jgi:hypothetical protein
MRKTFHKIKIFALISGLLLLPVSVSFAQNYGIQTKTSGCTANQVLPDPSCTPGAVLTTNTKIICVVGYTKTVRNVPLSEAKKVFAEYGISYSQHSNYEVDHLISLELGGSNDISNLFPESHLIKNNSYTKDAFENYLHSQVCSGKLSITEAQREISTDWLTYNTARLNSKTSTVKTSQPVIPKTTTPVLTTPIIQIPATVVSEPAVKKSSTGLCHAKGTTYYARTTNYTAYISIASCLASGGRLPLQ